MGELRTDFSLVTDESSLRDLEPHWRKLAVSSGNAFLTPEWYALARLKLERETVPLVAIASRGEEILGILPMVRGRTRASPARFAGAALGDRFGSLLASQGHANLGQELVEFLHRVERRPLELTRVAIPPTRWDARRKPRVIQASGGVLPAIDFGPGGWEEYLATRSRNLRTQIGRRQRKLERDHDVEIWSPSSQSDVTRGMDELFRLHGKRWSQRTEHSRFDRSDAQAFHAELASTLAELSWLRLLVLRVEDRAVAAWYGWRLGSTVSYYQAGFDPGWGARGVGGVLFAASIERAAREGAETYDMLLGDEGFKLRYATRIEAVRNAVVAPAWSLTLWRAVAIEAIRPAWRAMPVSVRSVLRR